MARDSWFIRTTALRDQLLANNRPRGLAPARGGGGPLRRVAGEQRRLGPLPQPLLGHAAARVGVRRATRSTWSSSAPSPSWREARGPLPEAFDPHRPFIDEYALGLRASGCGGTMRRTPEVIDVWYDSGAMPFAQWHYPFENRGGGRAPLPGGLHLRGGGPDPRVVLLADGDLHAAGPRTGVPQRGGERPGPRRRGPEDVEVAGERGGPVGRDRGVRRGRDPLVPAGQLATRGCRSASTRRACARCSARSSTRCAAPTTSSRSTPTWRGGSRRWKDVRPAERPLMDRWLLSRLAVRRPETVSERPGGVQPHPRGARAGRLHRGRPLQLVRPPLARPLLGQRRQRGRARGLRHAAARRWWTSARLVAPFAPFLADWLHRALTTGRACTSRASRRRTRTGVDGAAGARDGGGARRWPRWGGPPASGCGSGCGSRWACSTRSCRPAWSWRRSCWRSCATS